MKKALIVVDVQNDFVEGGSLAVAGGVALAERLAEYVTNNAYDLVVITQDWHINPGNHFSETPDYIDSWPVHCVSEDLGSEIVSVLKNALESLENTVFVRKGMFDASYSGFDGVNLDTNENLASILRLHEIESVDVTGIATDYCVRATALDARAEGFETTVLTEYIAGINEEKVSETLNTEFPAHNIIIK